MKYIKLLIVFIICSIIGYFLRNAIDYSTSQGKYKKENAPSHFDNQLNIQKYLYEQKQKNKKNTSP